MLLFRSLSTLALALAAIAAPVTDDSLEDRAAPTNGINNYNCRATPGKDPILFLHGLNAPAAINWLTKAPIFSARGYCTYTPQYGTKGLILGGAAIEESSTQVAEFVDRILATTGAQKVNIVAHSMGTLVTAYYLKYDGGAAKVSNYVGIGSIVRGTTLYGLGRLVASIPLAGDIIDKICASCQQVLVPNAFLERYQQGGIAVPGPAYTMIVSTLDETVVPYTNGFIYEPGVTNIAIQDHCKLDIVGHLFQAIDPNVTQLILWALSGRNGPRPFCIPFFLPGRRDTADADAEYITDPTARSEYFPSG
jgi:pimeloyl-ACP methyl ester carboxylesterase